MAVLFEASESYEGGTLGAEVTTSNTIFQSITMNGASGRKVRFGAGRSGLGMIKESSTSGTGQVGYGLPGVTLSGTNPSTLATDPGGTVIVSTWCKVESGPLGAGTSVIYLEAANVHLWETDEGDGTYSDFDAVVVQFAPLTWDGFTGEGGGVGGASDTIYISQHGPGWQDYGDPAWDTFGVAPLGEWLKYEISYKLDNSSRVTVQNEAGETLIDTGWKEGPGGFRASSVWMRMRGTSSSSQVHFTHDDFSLRIESVDTAIEADPVTTRARFYEGKN